MSNLIERIELATNRFHLRRQDHETALTSDPFFPFGEAIDVSQTPVECTLSNSGSPFGFEIGMTDHAMYIARTTDFHGKELDALKQFGISSDALFLLPDDLRRDILDPNTDAGDILNLPANAPILKDLSSRISSLHTLTHEHKQRLLEEGIDLSSLTPQDQHIAKELSVQGIQNLSDLWIFVIEEENIGQAYRFIDTPDHRYHTRGRAAMRRILKAVDVSRRIPDDLNSIQELTHRHGGDTLAQGAGATITGINKPSFLLVVDNERSNVIFSVRLDPKERSVTPLLTGTVIDWDDGYSNTGVPLAELTKTSQGLYVTTDHREVLGWNMIVLPPSYKKVQIHRLAMTSQSSSIERQWEFDFRFAQDEYGETHLIVDVPTDNKPKTQYKPCFAVRRYTVENKKEDGGTPLPHEAKQEEEILQPKMGNTPDISRIDTVIHPGVYSIYTKEGWRLVSFTISDDLTLSQMTGPESPSTERTTDGKGFVTPPPSGYALIQELSSMRTSQELLTAASEIGHVESQEEQGKREQLFIILIQHPQLIGWSGGANIAESMRQQKVESAAGQMQAAAERFFQDIKGMNPEQYAAYMKILEEKASSTHSIPELFTLTDDEFRKNARAAIESETTQNIERLKKLWVLPQDFNANPVRTDDDGKSLVTRILPRRLRSK